MPLAPLQSICAVDIPTMHKSFWINCALLGSEALVCVLVSLYLIFKYKFTMNNV